MFIVSFSNLHQIPHQPPWKLFSIFGNIFKININKIKSKLFWGIKKILRCQIGTVMRMTYKSEKCSVQKIRCFECRVSRCIIVVNSSPQRPMFCHLLLTAVKATDKHLVVYHSALLHWYSFVRVLVRVPIYYITSKKKKTRDQNITCISRSLHFGRRCFILK